MKANEHLELLGLPVQDRVTKFKGVVTGINFDLYGCVQAVVTPEASDGKITCGEWFDVTSLKVMKSKPVMQLPDFEQGYDNDYVEALKEQADLMAHYLQMVVEQSKCKGNLSREVVITNADQAIDNYFAMQQRFNND
jgi:hypothetical protein